ncbi:MAG: hypothetical protein IIU11_07975 [Bacteroidales bacterium]|nr:hypothetical protein [Bacteroidales bacterium]
MRLLLIIFIVFWLSGCKEGGVLIDDSAVLDSLSSTLSVKTYTIGSGDIVVYEGNLIFLEYQIQGKVGDESKDLSLVKIDKKGNKEVIHLKPEWQYELPEEMEDIKEELKGFEPESVVTNRLYKSPDGFLYAWGTTTPRFRSDVTAMSIVKFDKDCNIIYNKCVMYSTQDYEGNNLKIPKYGIPLSNSKFAVIMQKEKTYDYYTGAYGQEEWSIMVLDSDGNTESDNKINIDLSSYSLHTIFSSNDVICFNCVTYRDEEYRKIYGYSTSGELLNTLTLSYDSGEAIYTGNSTFMIHIDKDKKEIGGEIAEGVPMTIEIGKYGYDKFMFPEIETNYFEDSDSTYVIIGGSYCSGNEFLYGYCRENYTGSRDADYIYNITPSKGIILKDNKLYKISGLNPIVIVGVWYENGIYGIYYRELRPEDNGSNVSFWSNKVHYIEVDDLKKLEF